MEDDKKGGDSMPQQQDIEPTFKTADIHKTKAGQSDVQMNVHETRAGKFKKSSAKVGEWIYHHYKHIFITVISIAVVAVGVFVGVCVVPKIIKESQHTEEPQQVVVEEVDHGRPVNSDYNNILDEADRIYDNNPDNAGKVADYYKKIIKDAMGNNDFGKTNTILAYAVDFLERKQQYRIAADMLIDILPQANNDNIHDETIRNYCRCRLHNLAQRIDDEKLKEQYIVTGTDSQSLAILSACVTMSK